MLTPKPKAWERKQFSGWTCNFTHTLRNRTGQSWTLCPIFFFSFFSQHQELSLSTSASHSLLFPVWQSQLDCLFPYRQHSFPSISTPWVPQQLSSDAYERFLWPFFMWEMRKDSNREKRKSKRQTFLHCDGTEGHRQEFQLCNLFWGILSPLHSTQFTCTPWAEAPRGADLLKIPQVTINR